LFSCIVPLHLSIGFLKTGAGAGPALSNDCFHISEFTTRYYSTIFISTTRFFL
jgi:hypothetical protein